jgi:pilus assembly protein CpaB
MRGSRLLILAGAAILAVVAILLALRYQGQDPAAPKAAPQRTAVIALKPIKFGENLTPENIAEKPWPADLPEGAFTAKAEALSVDPVGNVPRMAMRPIAVNEVVMRSAVSGEASRLSSSPLLGPNMRAVAVPLSEATGAGGFVQPGDRVDLFLIRKLEGDANNTSIADLLVQNVRVLAVGQIADTTREEAVVVRTATLELSPPQAQKVALAQNVGVITVALRSNADDGQTRVPTIRTNDLRDGAAPARAAPRVIVRTPRRAAPPPEDPAVTVVRGTETAQVKVAS